MLTQLANTDQCLNRSLALTAQPALVPSHAVKDQTKSRDRVLGILGLIVVGAILGLSTFLVMKYLM